jgi:hypothetical protein
MYYRVNTLVLLIIENQQTTSSLLHCSAEGWDGPINSLALRAKNDVMQQHPVLSRKLNL